MFEAKQTGVNGCLRVALLILRVSYTCGQTVPSSHVHQQDAQSWKKTYVSVFLISKRLGSSISPLLNNLRAPLLGIYLLKPPSKTRR